MLTFMSGCLAGRPYREQVEAAGAAGFGAITIWPNVLRHARTKEGLSLRDMRALLDDNGLVLADFEGCADWKRQTPDANRRGPTRHDYLEVCATLGAANLGAIHPPGAPLNLEEASEAFAILCDDAAAFGLNVALEFIATSALSDAATASRIVALAGRRNGGLVLDLWHHFRGAAQGDPEALRDVPPDRIFTIQLSDGPRHSDLPLQEETMYHRLLPGQGEMGAADFMQSIAQNGVSAFYGPEVYLPSFEGRPTLEIMHELVAATRAIQPDGTVGEPR
jgi:sugar phosphate isomerase/epimerase